MLTGWAFTVVTAAVIAAGIGVGVTRMTLKERHGFALRGDKDQRMGLMDCYRAGSPGLVILHVALTIICYGLLAWLAVSFLTGDPGTGGGATSGTTTN
ncbi:MAG: hypothetical protein AAFR44_15485 [Pseudomonadota bacterium]